MKLELAADYGFQLYIGPHPIRAGAITEVPDVVWDRFKDTGLVSHLFKAGILSAPVAQDDPEEMPGPLEEPVIASGPVGPTDGDAGSMPAGSAIAIAQMCKSELLEVAKELNITVPKRSLVSLHQLRKFIAIEVRHLENAERAG